MTIIYLLVAAAILLAGSFLAAFVWATKSGQWDDLDTPPHRILKNNKEKV